MPPLFTIYSETPDYGRRPEGWNVPGDVAYARLVEDHWLARGYAVAVDFWFDKAGLHLHIIVAYATGYRDADNKILQNTVIVGSVLKWNLLWRIFSAGLRIGRSRHADNGHGDIPPWEDIS